MKKLATYFVILILLGIIILIVFPPLDQPIAIDVRPSKLVLFNNTIDTLQYAVFERNALRSIDWEPCDHPRLCSDSRIRPGLMREIPYELIHRWHPGAEVIVYWWLLEPDTTAQNGYRLDGPYEVTVATPRKALPGT